MKIPFVHLHLHGEYSLIDGLIRIDDLVAATKKTGCSAVALTDQCNLFAMVKFYQAAIKAGVKPIIGADLLLLNESNPKEPHRCIMLCQNEQGYRNLTELVSKSYVEGQSLSPLGRPLIHKSWLRMLNQGLIVIASSRQSDVAEALMAGKEDLAESLIEYWSGIFPNRFYLEITRLGRNEENTYIQAAVSLAERKGCPLVATNDVRFLRRDDFDAHEARVCIHEGYTLNDTARAKVYVEEQYLKTPDDMNELFSDVPEALENSFEIAKRCNLEIKLGQVFLPQYPVPLGYTVEQYFSETAHAALEKKIAFQNAQNVQNTQNTLNSLNALNTQGSQNPQNSKPLQKIKDYQERLALEISVINSMGFAGYFLIVADFIRWAKKNDVPVGPGRGSGAGSLVAYLLDITGLDPLQHELLFERFLNPERVSLPDFDIDFCMEGRDRVIEYVANTYGRESVSQIITFGTMAAKAVIRDVGRVLGHPYGFVDKIAKLVPMELGMTLSKALEDEDMLKKRYQEEEEVKNLIDLARKLEGVPRNAGKHAGGVVIAPSKLTDFSPLYCDANEGIVLTQFDKNDVETIGLVKFDFLGLRTLTIIDRAVKLVNEVAKEKGQESINIDTLPMDDKKTFELLRKCHTTAVFQLESRGMQDLVRRLQPDNFEEIVALVALFRPGPLQSGMVDDFINRKHGRAMPDYLHPKLTQILKPTYGVILYQEQVMQIAQVLAGYTLGAADILRKAMGKKKPEEMAKQRAVFISGAVARGVEERIASYIFDLMEKFAGYGFNKSHSAAYAVLTYQTAWLKTHYPAAFMAAVLSCDMAHTDKVVIFLEECKKIKLKILPPSINASDFRFAVKNDQEILYGLGAIKGVGEAAIACLVEARKERPFQDIFDLCARMDGRKVNRRVLEALIRAGALDELGAHRASLMESLTYALQAAEQLQKNRIQQQQDLFGGSLSMQDIGGLPQYSTLPTWSKQQILEGEKETLGFYLSGHPLDQHVKELRQMTSGCIRDLRLDRNKRCTISGLITTFRAVQTKRGDRMAFITVDDQTGRQEVAIFSDLYQSKRELLIKDALVVIEGELSMDNFSGGYKMRAMTVMNLDEARSRAAKSLEIEVVAEKMNAAFSKELYDALLLHKGNVKIKLYYHKQDLDLNIKIKGFVKVGETWAVHPTQALLDTLRNLEGISQVEFCY